MGYETMLVSDFPDTYTLIRRDEIFKTYFFPKHTSATASRGQLAPSRGNGQGR